MGWTRSTGATARPGWPCHADYETIPTPDWPEAGPIRGREAAWDFYEELDEPWEGTGPFALDELVAADDGRVAVHLTRELVGRASGAAVGYD